MSGAAVVGIAYVLVILFAGFYRKRKPRYAPRHRTIAQVTDDTLTGLSSRDREWLNFLIKTNKETR